MEIFLGEETRAIVGNIWRWITQARRGEVGVNVRYVLLALEWNTILT
jgi:hypothetical protein